MKLHRNNNWTFSSLWNMDILKLLLVPFFSRCVCLYFINRFPAVPPPNEWISERVYVHAGISVHTWMTHVKHLFVQNCPDSSFESNLTLTGTWTSTLKHVWCASTQFGFNLACVSFYKLSPMDQHPWTQNNTEGQWYLSVSKIQYACRILKQNAG